MEARSVLKVSRQMAVLTLDLMKHCGPTPADDTASQIITDWGNVTLNFKELGFCASPPLSNGPFLYLSLTLMLSLVQKYLDTRTETLVVHFLDTTVGGGS